MFTQAHTSDVFQRVWVRSCVRAPFLLLILSHSIHFTVYCFSRFNVATVYVCVYASKYWNPWHCSRSTYLTGYVVVYHVDEKWVKMEKLLRYELSIHGKSAVCSVWWFCSCVCVCDRASSVLCRFSMQEIFRNICHFGFVCIGFCFLRWTVEEEEGKGKKEKKIHFSYRLFFFSFPLEISHSRW